MLVLFRLALFLVTLLIPLMAFAKPLLSVSIKVEKELILTSNGEKVTTRVGAANINHGDVIFYTLIFSYSGDEETVNAVFVDPIPKGTIYMSGSAFGNGCV
jgi:uncharacterized repeat protein (TIGR01451 family)